MGLARFLRRRRDDADPGLEAIRFYYESASIDPEWSSWDDRSFVWWPYRLAQRVSADPAIPSHGFEVCKLRAVTELVGDVAPEKATSVLPFLATTADLSSFGYDPATRTVMLACTTYVHADSVDWAKRLFMFAAAVQVAAAEAKAEPLCRALEGELKASSHPANGFRSRPDEMLQVVPEMVLPKSQPVAPLLGDELIVLQKQLAQQTLANGDHSSLVVEFPYGPDGGIALEGKRSCLLLVDTDQPHPGLGEGVLFRLFIPEEPGKMDRGQLVLELNRREFEEFVAAHHLGSWCVGPLPGGLDRGAVFVSFLPAVALRPGLVTTLVQSMGGRARWLPDAVSGLQSVTFLQ